MSIYTEALTKLETTMNNFKSLQKKEVEFEALKKKYPSLKLHLMVSDGRLDFDLYNTTMDESKNLLKDLAKLGHHLVGKPHQSGELKGYMWKLTGSVGVWSRFENGEIGKSCKYVQTGVRTEPIFEIVCG